MNEGLLTVLKVFLKKEKVNIHQEELGLQLFSHPSYPSLHSVTGVLDHFGVENMALEVPTNLETLEQLPENFIAYIEKEGTKEFVLVTKSDNDKVDLFFGDKKKKSLSNESFLNIWQGIIVVVEVEKAEELTSKSINLKEPLLIMSVAFLIGFVFYSEASVFQIVSLIVASFGVYFSSLIVQQELGFNSLTLNKICNNTKTTSCNDVLNSTGAKVFKSIKLSDLSIIYFSSIVLYFLLTVINGGFDYSIFMAITIFSLPITLYSVYYQYKIVKKWCLLCLGIVAILWLQFIAIAVFNDFSFSNFSLNEFSIVFFSFVLISAVWSTIKPLLEAKKSLQETTIEHYKFKRNFKLFDTLLSNEKTINTRIDVNNKEIVLGNENAIIDTVLITNPGCFYCKDAHRDVEELLKSASNSIKVTIRFSVPDDNNNMATKVANRLTEIYNTNPENIEKALHDAYRENANLEDWLQQWKEASNDSYIDILNQQRDWCHENLLNFTPAFLVNGKQFPREYKRADLQYFVEDLTENFEESTIELSQA